RAACARTPTCAGVALARGVRSDDPGPEDPELALRLEPRGGPPVVLAVAPRTDGLPYAPEEAAALADAGRLAALALADALDAARLEREVALRTAALRRALDDRGELVAAAERIQAAADRDAVRAAVERFLTARTGAAAPDAPHRVVATLCRMPVGRETLAAPVADGERAADLQPQVDLLCALADGALERLHLLEGLKREVERQAAELADVAADRRHAAFVRQAAHELRKPGEEIRQLVAELAPQVPAGALAALARIEDAACQLGRRLDTLLSRQGRRLDRRRVDLVRLVDEAVRRAALLRPRRFAVAHERERLPLLGDPVRLLALVENLIDNAVRATGEDGVVALRTGAEQARGEPPLVRLEVEDDGPGVAPELGDAIFEPGVGAFPGGSGLGLALCRECVALHRGAIEVESRPGRTVFRVRLPRWPGAPP